MACNEITWSVCTYSISLPLFGCNEQNRMTIHTYIHIHITKVVLFTSASRAVDDVHCLSEVLVVGVHLL